MRRIAIHDANILIDLVKTGLLDHCMSFEYRFTTTDIVFYELHEIQQAPILPHITSGRFSIMSIADIELQEIATLNQEDHRLSPQDCSALYFALENNYILLTGDKEMRNMAKRKTIEYYGIFWLFDQLVEGSIINKKEALHFLEKLEQVNRRLPSDEFEKEETAGNRRAPHNHSTLSGFTTTGPPTPVSQLSTLNSQLTTHLSTSTYPTYILIIIRLISTVDYFVNDVPDFILVI